LARLGAAVAAGAAGPRAPAAATAAGGGPEGGEAVAVAEPAGSADVGAVVVVDDRSAERHPATTDKNPKTTHAVPRTNMSGSYEPIAKWISRHAKLIRCSTS